jgi:hypothetical protein
MRSAGRALRSLPLRGQRPLARPRGSLRPPGCRRLSGRAPSVQPAPDVRRRQRDPNVRPPRLRRRYPLPAARRRGRTRAAGSSRGRCPQCATDAACASTAASRLSRVLPRRLPARGVARRRLAVRATLAPSGDPDGRAGGRRLPGAPDVGGARAARSPRPRSSLDRVREGPGDDRRRARARRCGSDRPALRGARGHGRDALTRKSPRKCRSREPRAHQSCRTRPAARGRASAQERRACKIAPATPGDCAIARAPSHTFAP